MSEKHLAKLSMSERMRPLSIRGGHESHFSPFIERSVCVHIWTYAAGNEIKKKKIPPSVVG